MPAGAAGLTALADTAAGATLLAGGVAVRIRGARTGCVPLMLLTGVAWFAGDVWSGLLYVHRGPLAHLLLAYPGGRLRTSPVAALVAAAYVDGLVPSVAVAAWPTIVLAAALIAAAAARRRAAPAGERRPRTVALGAAAAIGATLATAAAARVAGRPGSDAALLAYVIAVAGSGAALTCDLLWGRWGERRVRELIVGVGDDPRALRAALARTLDDPGLELGYRSAGGDAWEDEQGRPLALPAPGAGRRVTLIPAEAPVAVLVHQEQTLEDERLAASVAAAVRLAARTRAAQAQVIAQLDEISVSTRRLVETADEERRDLAEQVHAGPDRDLQALSHRLGELAASREGDDREELRGLAAELAAARDDLSRFAHGVRPRALTEHGLRAALEPLASGAGVPVELSVVDGRFPAPVEAAAYFVCSEGLANVVKHAAASRAAVRIAVDGPALVVEVADDGRGGADAGAGSGLRGLADRLQALGGTLRVDSPAGGGTRLAARLPIPSAAGA